MGDGEGPSWSDIAGWYDDLLTAGSGPHQTAVATLLALLPPVTGREIVDVACGTGLATRAVAAAGAARVVGVDSSAAMVARAEGHEVPAGSDVTYVVDDAQTLATLADAAFDGATCQLGLMDIPDLDATLAAVARVLRPGGWFVFVIGHPCTLVPDAVATTTPDGRPAVAITGYFDERFWRSANPEGVRRAGNHHRTFATYLDALAGAGFVLEQAAEPRATGTLSAKQPLYSEVPIFFAARVRRG
ncbi:class I SAM-dependent methyltransferase [Iamia sp. SCSIO 61187]|uniref:class I SAM-dependent methyltransferase n=1 Tax=Iamia sp. SCSIO 61187 TaxID=2722752 RepID=UPI001C625302|nr:class I SAM-dependent methyltransferase [Iamia sp. SCSIO 61187]QYG92141.1 class I SAM-dependent methyltransferase [Iamia sp. SCSIO 61187]